MLTAQAPEHFRLRARERRIDLKCIGLDNAVDLVIEWFENERADDADPLHHDGDGLLIQWGTYLLDSAPMFQFDLTRQFSLSRDDDQCLWQLSLTLHYTSTYETSALGSGSRWCFDPAAAPQLRSDIRTWPAMQHVEHWQPQQVTLKFNEEC